MEIGFQLLVPGQLGQRLYDALDESSATDRVPSTSATALQLGLTEPAAAVRVVADVSSLDGLAAKVYAIADRWCQESGRQFVPLLVQSGHADAAVKVHDSANQAAVVKQVVEVIRSRPGHWATGDNKTTGAASCRVHRRCRIPRLALSVRANDLEPIRTQGLGWTRLTGLSA